MDRVASLRLAAEQLRVSIFRSLPLGFRVAHVIVRASGYGGLFGPVFGAIFLKAKVEGMPDPGPSWNPASPRAADTLPSGYYSRFGESLYRTMLRKYRDAEFVEDTMLNFIADRTLEKDLNVREGSSRQEAEGLVFRAVNNFFLDKLRVVQQRKKLAPTGPMHRTDAEGGETEVDVEDPRGRDVFEEHATRAVINKIKTEIARVVDWAPGWFDLMLDDHRDSDIIGDPQREIPSLLAQQMKLDPPYLLSPAGKPMTIKMWSTNYKPQILDIIKKVYSHG